MEISLSSFLPSYQTQPVKKEGFSAARSGKYWYEWMRGWRQYQQKDLKLSAENQDTWFPPVALFLYPSRPFILRESLFTFLCFYLIVNHL